MGSGFIHGLLTVRAEFRLMFFWGVLGRARCFARFGPILLAAAEVLQNIVRSLAGIACCALYLELLILYERLPRA